MRFTHGPRLVPAPDASGMVLVPPAMDSRLRAALRALTSPQLALLRRIWAGELNLRRHALVGSTSTTLLWLVRRGLVRQGDLTAAGLHALGRRSDDTRPDCRICAGLGGVPATAPACTWTDCRACGGSGFGPLAQP